MAVARRGFLSGVAATTSFLSTPAILHAEKRYDDGASDTEIKIGNFAAYSGPASAYGAIGKGCEAYWKAVNASGGINGRRIAFLTRDDGYNPAKSIEVTRELLEGERVLCFFATLGTAPNTSVQKYLNQKKVPHLYVTSGASRWGNPTEFPWTMGFQPTYHTEGVIHARHILANVPDPRIAVLMQNDDYGKDYWEGFREGLGKEAGRVVAHVTYEAADPTVDSQIIQLAASRANAFFNISTAKAAAQAIRKAADLGWKPAHYLNNVSSSVAAVMKPAGFGNAQGIITAAYRKDPTDRQWGDDPATRTWRVWMDKWMPGANQADANYVYAYAASAMMHETLRRCGDELTRANVMRQAASFRDHEVPMLLPGITVSTGPADFYPIQSMRLTRFQGETWHLFGEVMSEESR